jgi:N-acetylmuramoyl-L-alanine amidase
MQEEFLDQSIMLAKMMQDEFSGRLKRNDRKVKQAGFIVLHQTFMPSVLVETGFLTNKNEGSYLNSSKGQVEMGRAIAEAIITYKQNVRNAVSMVASSTPSATVPEKIIPNTEPTKEEAGSVREELKDEDITLVKQEVATVQKEIKSSQPVEKEESQPATSGAAVNNEGQRDLAMGTDIPVITKIEETEIKDKPEAGPAENPESGTVVFKVQLMASAKDLPLRPDDFRGLGNLSKEPYKNLYRYLYGNTNSYEEAKLLKTNADLKGYTTSFIVAYRDGIRLPMKEAMKYAGD